MPAILKTLQEMVQLSGWQLNESSLQKKLQYSDEEEKVLATLEKNTEKVSLNKFTYTSVPDDKVESTINSITIDNVHQYAFFRSIISLSRGDYGYTTVSQFFNNEHDEKEYDLFIKAWVYGHRYGYNEFKIIPNKIATHKLTHDFNYPPPDTIIRIPPNGNSELRNAIKGFFTEDDNVNSRHHIGYGDRVVTKLLFCKNIKNDDLLKPYQKLHKAFTDAIKTNDEQAKASSNASAAFYKKIEGKSIDQIAKMATKDQWEEYVNDQIEEMQDNRKLKDMGSGVFVSPHECATMTVEGSDFDITLPKNKKLAIEILSKPAEYCIVSGYDGSGDGYAIVKKEGLKSIKLARWAQEERHWLDNFNGLIASEKEQAKSEAQVNKAFGFDITSTDDFNNIVSNEQFGMNVFKTPKGYVILPVNY